MDVSKTWVEQGRSDTIWWVPAIMALVTLMPYVPWRKVYRRRRTGKEEGVR